MGKVERTEMCISIAVYPVRIERGSLQNFQGSRTIIAVYPVRIERFIMVHII